MRQPQAARYLITTRRSMSRAQTLVEQQRNFSTAAAAMAGGDSADAQMGSADAAGLKLEKPISHTLRN